MHVVFVAPFFKDTTLRFVRAVAGLPGVRCSLVTQEPSDRVPGDLRRTLGGYAQVGDALSAAPIAWAVKALEAKHGKVDKLLGTLEHIQEQLAEVREHLGIAGLGVEAARNFRDKARMKERLRAAGLPCARHKLLTSEADAWAFAKEVGFPQVIKPKEGAGAVVTFRVDSDEQLKQALKSLRPSKARPAVAEEFIVGDEHSFEVASHEGRPLWWSTTRYEPPPLDVVRNPWIQWTVLLPKERAGLEDVCKVGTAALQVLGMQTGISHMEWFRRKDGSLAISEIAARPPGAQIMTLNTFAHDHDMYQAWAELMVHGRFAKPAPQYATGAVFFRGQGQGKVQRVVGLEQAQREVGHLVVEARLPRAGQPQASSYEGEGYAIVRHPQTEVVHQALRHLVRSVRVELG